MKLSQTIFSCTFLSLCNLFQWCHSVNFKQDVCGSKRGSSSADSQQLYDPSSRKCYPFATRGPCGENMIFYKHPLYPKYGFCDCDQGFRSESPCNDHPVRRMFYSPNLKKCFPIFSQGPCEVGYWLTLEKSQSAEFKCQPNPCIRAQVAKDSNYDWMRNAKNKFWYFDFDSLRKSCYLAQTQGYCPVGLTLEIVHNSPLPKCRRKQCYGKITNFRSNLKCKPGSRYSYVWKGCVKKRLNNFIGIG